MDLRVYKNENQALGFAIACLFTQAITRSEFQTWLENVTRALDDPPIYIIDLLIWDGFIKDIPSIVGFSSSTGLTEDQHYVLDEIAWGRGVRTIENKMRRSRSKRAIKRYPQVLERFRSEFPFVEFSQ